MTKPLGLNRSRQQQQQQNSSENQNAGSAPEDESITLVELVEMFFAANGMDEPASRRDWNMGILQKCSDFMNGKGLKKELSVLEMDGLRVLSAWCIFNLVQMDRLGLTGGHHNHSCCDHDHEHEHEHKENEHKDKDHHKHHNEKEEKEEKKVRIPLANEFVNEISDSSFTPIKEYLSLLLKVEGYLSSIMIDDDDEEEEAIEEELEDEEKEVDGLAILDEVAQFVKRKEERPVSVPVGDKETFPPQVFPFAWDEKAFNDHLGCYLWQLTELLEGANHDDDMEEDDDEWEDVESEDETAAAADDAEMKEEDDDENDEEFKAPEEDDDEMDESMIFDNSELLVKLNGIILSLDDSSNSMTLAKANAHLYLAHTHQKPEHYEQAEAILKNMMSACESVEEKADLEIQCVSMLIQMNLEWAYIYEREQKERKEKLRSASEWLSKALSMPEGEELFGHMKDWQKEMISNDFEEIETNEIEVDH